MDKRRNLNIGPRPATHFRTLTLVCLACVLAACTGMAGSEPGSRSFGVFIDDEQLESRVTKAIRKAAPGLKSSHIVVRSYKARVLLAGQVPSEDLKTLAGTQAAAVATVRSVDNELEVSGRTTFLSRTNDSYISNRVRARMLLSDSVDSGNVKITTVNGKVYLAGHISRAEAAAAATIARKVRGVEKVVTLFEYLD